MHSNRLKLAFIGVRFARQIARKPEPCRDLDRNNNKWSVMGLSTQRLFAAERCWRPRVAGADVLL